MGAGFRRRTQHAQTRTPATSAVTTTATATPAINGALFDDGCEADEATAELVIGAVVLFGERWPELVLKLVIAGIGVVTADEMSTLLKAQKETVPHPF